MEASISEPLSSNSDTANNNTHPSPSPLLILDPGLGTTLQSLYPTTVSTPLWSSTLLLSSTGRDALRKTHETFAHAGSDIISTATYQATVPAIHTIAASIRQKRLEAGEPPASVPVLRPGDGRNLCREAIVLACGLDKADPAARPLIPRVPDDFDLTRNAGYNEWYAATGPRFERHAKVQVALSIGPYGATTTPSCEYAPCYPREMAGAQALREWHCDVLGGFVEARPDVLTRPNVWDEVDVVAYETIGRGDEIEAIRGAVGDVFWEQCLEGGRGRAVRPFWISLVFPGEAEGGVMTLPDGTGVGDAVEKMLLPVGGAVPWGIGVNCTAVRKLEGILKVMEEKIRSLIKEGRVNEWPALVVYPDGTEKGERWDPERMEWVKDVPAAEDGEARKVADGDGDAGRKWDEDVFNVVDPIRRKGCWKMVLVGGCCRSTVEDIRKLKARFDEAQKNDP